MERFADIEEAGGSSPSETTKKNEIIITSKHQKNEKNKCVSVQEIVPFKIISLNAFYTLLIEKKFDLFTILSSADN